MSGKAAVIEFNWIVARPFTTSPISCRQQVDDGALLDRTNPSRPGELAFLSAAKE